LSITLKVLSHARRLLFCGCSPDYALVAPHGACPATDGVSQRACRLAAIELF
jgi:hypothetical protein